MHTLSNLARSLALFGAVALAGTAHANLVSNGGFEAGDLSSWTVTPCGGSCASIINAGSSPGLAHGGTWYAAFAAIGGIDTITQTIATTAGTTYDVSFWLRNYGGTPNSFAFNWNGGAAELSLTNAPAAGNYTQYTFSLTASAASTSLVFAGRQDPSAWLLDDVTVNAATAVPEPGSLALACLALAGLGLAGRRHRAG